MTRPLTQPPEQARPAALSPGRVIARWPADQPLVAARRPTDGSWLFGSSRLTLRVTGPASSPSIAWLDPATGQPTPAPIESTADPFKALDSAVRRFSTGQGCWIGSMSYDLAGLCEPKALTGPGPSCAEPNCAEPSWPLAEFHRCDDLWILNAAGHLRAVGSPPPLNENPPPAPPLNLQFSSELGRAGYAALVRRTLALIRAGDIYEANIAHRLIAQHRSNPRAIAAVLLDAAGPAHGAYLELAGVRARAIASASPESFLHFDAARRTLRTRPMKGTRLAAEGARAELEASPKERAELHMITDLMRNDLGRVCEMGSVRVVHDRLIEPHASGSLLQASSLVEGTLRPELSLAEALSSLLPAGSITGAPKVRAMQVIRELEGYSRGPWCGCCALLEDSGEAHLSVAIRTALIDGSRVVYPVGAGIVADSEPEAEWDETLAKASVLLAMGTVVER